MTEPRTAPRTTAPAARVPARSAPPGRVPVAPERAAGPHDPGPPEQYAGEPVPDPWAAETP
ncbi:hypothetical protein ACTOB_007204 [Actinoplanes oblitus]|uniref:Uncharacterized protein n=1 Tax=Actinoplanes oblitus TaxID=3040509 RepID=A0ABY8WDK4_9ACTN|nr:hypothetical protein [Actinoplanes oblitus]WIM95133.1 hypothetical protein ACTOB_007204 [Actinoplanes oblitus]